MSHTVIYVFHKNGDASEYACIQNAWRGAMAVWQEMEMRHLPARFSSRMHSLRKELWQEVWDLGDDPKVPTDERICMYTTFDDTLIHKEDIPKVIKAFRSFGAQTSLPEQADILESILNGDAGEDIIAAGWGQNDVVAGWDTKGGIDGEGNSTPYNCLTGTKHFWLFDELAKDVGKERSK